MFIECPHCHIQVWISKNGQCPSCRTQMPEEILNLMKLEAGINQTQSPAAQSTGSTVDQSAAPAAHHELPLLPSAYRSVEPTMNSTRVVRRTNWSMLLMGIFMVLLGGVMFLMPANDDASRSTSRRVRAVERAIGAQATAFLAGVVLIGGGAWVIYASRTEMIAGESISDASHRCDLCDKTSSDTAVAFVTVAGGPDLLTNIIRGVSPAFERKYGTKDRFPGVFQCHTCDDCIRASHRLVLAHNLQAILLCSTILAALFAGFAGIAPFTAPTQDPKPAFGILITVIWGILLLHAISISLLQRYISRGTSRLLGSRLDPIIRQIVGIECWGWRRCVILSRFVSEKTPIIDTTQK
jgi:hypothetical protein